MSKFNFSPSLLHHHLLGNMEQSMSYKGGDVQQWQNTLRSKLKELIGHMPTEKCALNVRSLWKREHKLGTIEKIVFTSEAFCDVPAYICLPGKSKAPYTTFVCLQGHSTGMHNSIAVDFATNENNIKVSGDRDFGLSCMQNGIAALCIEQRSFGERRENEQKIVSEHMCHDAVFHALQLGRTLTGERIWDVERGLDYLAERGDIDMDNIGLMGNSGGGTVTMYASAILDRIAYAMPSCSFCTFADSIMNYYHCGDNYIPGLLKYADAADIMGLHAPKPLVIVTGREDASFPVNGVKKAFADLQSIYSAAGAEDKCKLIIGEGGHRFYANEAWPAMLEMIN
jgi:dienelactone hydrolase